MQTCELCTNFRIPGPDGHWVVTYTGTFSKQKIKTSGIRYRYCVAINNDPSNVLEEYVYNAYKVDENNLRNLQQSKIPGIKKPTPILAYMALSCN